MTRANAANLNSRKKFVASFAMLISGTRNKRFSAGWMMLCFSGCTKFLRPNKKSRFPTAIGKRRTKKILQLNYKSESEDCQ